MPIHLQIEPNPKCSYSIPSQDKVEISKPSSSLSNLKGKSVRYLPLKQSTEWMVKENEFILHFQKPFKYDANRWTPCLRIEKYRNICAVLLDAYRTKVVLNHSSASNDLGHMKGFFDFIFESNSRKILKKLVESVWRKAIRPWLPFFHQYFANVPHLITRVWNVWTITAKPHLIVQTLYDALAFIKIIWCWFTLKIHL